MKIVDALGRTIELAVPPRRIVSLVPSETESVAALGALDRLCGRTVYCEEPAGRIEAVATVGGTKNVDVDAVIALAPDLVLANREENTKQDVERLIARGVTVHVSFPCTLEETARYLENLGAMSGSSANLYVEAIRAIARPPSRWRIFAPVWRDPWMTFDGRTYASDVLAAAGGANVFAERARRYPLAADLGQRAAIHPGERDTRYPRLTRDEILAERPDVTLLPDEPYPFSSADEAELAQWGLSAMLTSGKDLFWYGVRTAAAVERLRAAIERHVHERAPDSGA